MSNVNDQTNIKYPVIIIPGVCGSKLVSQDKETHKKRIVWVHGSLNYPHIASKFLWGKHETDGKFHSFVDEYANIYAKPGINGVDQLVEMQILANYTNYFGKLTNYLVKHAGYELERNLFAYSYDWRQDISHECIQSPLNKLIKDVMAANGGRKVILLTHSMGGLVAEQYMRMHPNEWDNQIVHLLALMTPFNGSSGWANISQMIGYNLQLPCPLSTAKGIQANSISPLYLQIRCNINQENNEQGFIQEESSFLPTFGQVYIKKVKEQTQLQILKRKLFSGKDSIQSLLCRKYTQQLNQKTQKICIDDIKLNGSLYDDKVPDIAFIIAKRIYDCPNLINQKELGVTMKFLQHGCLPGSLIIKGQKLPIKRIKEVNLFDVQTIKQMESHRQFEWEVYHPWASNTTYEIPYVYNDSKYMKIVDNDLHFTQQFQEALKYYNKQKVIYQTEFQDIKEFAICLQYWQESQSDNFSRQKIGCTCGCTKHQEHGEQTVNRFSYPWISPAARSNYKPESLETLLSRMHPTGTLEHIMFGTDHRMYEQVMNTRNIPLKIPEGTEFRFTSISGIGRKTPLHAIFDTPVRSYIELNMQIPRMLQADGDGTVLLTAALGDPFPAQVVHERILVREAEHFGFLQERTSFEMIAHLLEDIQRM